MGVIAVAEILLANRFRSSCALSYIPARHFDVDSAARHALAAANREEAFDFGEYPVERARFISRGGLDRVSVHRIAGPENGVAFIAHGPEQRREQPLHRLMAHATDERNPSSPAVWVEGVEEAEEGLAVQAGAAFDPDWV